MKNRVAVSPFHRYLERVYSHPVFHTSPSIYSETYVWLHSRLVPGCSVLLEEGGGRTLGLFSRRVLCTSLGVAPAGSKHSRGLNGLSSTSRCGKKNRGCVRHQEKRTYGSIVGYARM